MKIRQGFVSNSSSSSFVIIIKKPDEDSDWLDDLYANIWEEFYYGFLDPDRCKDILTKGLQTLTSISNSNLDEYYRADLKQLNNLLTLIETTPDNKAQLTKHILKHLYNIYITENEDCVIFDGNVTMKNSISDYPEVIKDLFIYFMLSDYTVKFKEE